MSETRIILKKNEERRIKSGHQWIFSNEIAQITGNPENGSVVEVYIHNGNFLCKAFYNKHSLISLRLLTRNKNENFDSEFLRKRLLDAFRLRSMVFSDRNSYRLVNGESDFLPGLVIDKYNDKFSLKIYSLGMEKQLDLISKLITELFEPELIIAKNDFEQRTLEGLDRYEKILFQKNENSVIPFIIDLDGIKFKIDLISGQKTGFYLDQNSNRKKIRQFINKESVVLDLFCNEGGFSLNAAYSGAREILGIDSSQVAINKALENSELNNLNNIKFLRTEVFDYISKNDISKYNFVILDPPSFAKSRKQVSEAVRGYTKLNSGVMKALKPSSLLFTFSCSHNINESEFNGIISKSASIAGKNIQILEFVNCSPDHPVLPSMDETKYLKGFLLRIL